MTWVGWLAIYLAAGALLGEAALLAMRRKGSPLTGRGYVALVLCWGPVCASVILAALFKKGK